MRVAYEVGTDTAGREALVRQLCWRDFYTQLFGTAPTVRKDDYAKWMLEDPRLNFAISSRTGRAGVEHLGLQVDDGDELEAVRARLLAAAGSVEPEKDASCCYARSDKYWAIDPQGVAWEAFHTLGKAKLYGNRHGPGVATSCCAA